MRMILFFFLLCTSPAMACGVDSNCPVGDRHYRISMPEGHSGDAKVGALIWSHGYRGSAAGVMRNTALRRMVSDAGLALIAAQGVGGSWDLPYGPSTFDSTGATEFAYFDAVISDAVRTHGIDPARILASGFSAGGMMVWNLACARPDRFAGFIPMSGTFWLKPPETCSAPVASIVHIHGDADKTVPLTGRKIRETKQGEVEEALAFYSAFGTFEDAAPTNADSLTCRNQAQAQGNILELCLFSGGHSFNTKHLLHGINRMKAAGQI